MAKNELMKQEVMYRKRSLWIISFRISYGILFGDKSTHVGEHVPRRRPCKEQTMRAEWNVAAGCRSRKISQMQHLCIAGDRFK